MIREPATIAYATYGMHEHFATLTVDIGFNLEVGFQSFGNVCLDEETGPIMRDEICKLFGVKAIEQLKGRRCYVLRSWPSRGEPIEGIEVDGRRWTLTTFRRKHWPETKDRLTDRKLHIQQDIMSRAEEIRRAVERLKTVDNGYVEWSTMKDGELP